MCNSKKSGNNPNVHQQEADGINRATPTDAAAGRMQPLGGGGRAARITMQCSLGYTTKGAGASAVKWYSTLPFIYEKG